MFKKTLPKTKQLVLSTLYLLKTNWLLLAKIGLIYAVASYFLVGGVSQTNYLQLKELVGEIFAVQPDFLGVSTVVLVATVSGETSTQQGGVSNILGWVLALVFWLAVVWALKTADGKKVIKARETLYNGSTPLVTSAVILFVMAVQLIPAAMGLYLILLVQSGLAAVSWLASAAIALVGVLLVAISLYWLVGSLMALVAATYKQYTYPFAALRHGWQLVKKRRGVVLIRLLLLLVALIVSWAILLALSLFVDHLLNIAWLPVIPVVFQLLSASSLILVAVFVFKLYTDLKDE